MWTPNTLLYILMISALTSFNEAYTTAAIDQATKAMSELPLQEAFEKLAAVLLCRLVSFNKLRPEEPAKLMVDKYQRCSNWQNSNAEILASLAL